MKCLNHQSKLMASLFFILWIVTVCLSEPIKSLKPQVAPVIVKRISLPIYSNSSLKARDGSDQVDPRYVQFLADLKEAEDDDAAVGQGEEMFLAFSDSTESILASHGFVGCVGVVIVSTKAAVIGHYSNTDDGMKDAKDNLPDLLNNHKKELLGGQAWIYAHVRVDDPDTFVSDDNNKILKDIVSKSLGMDCAMEKYAEPSDFLMDDNGDVKDNADDLYDQLKTGGVMVKHSGDASAPAEVIFVNLGWQSEGM